jgi:hypothetical protein
VAADSGCSWNSTPEDLQVVEEKTREREAREIIRTIHPERKVAEIHTHTVVSGTEISEVKTRVSSQKENSRINQDRPSGRMHGEQAAFP